MFRLIYARALSTPKSPNLSFSPYSSSSPTELLKTLDTATKYSPADTARILSVVNDATTVATLDSFHQRYDITKGRARTICSWRNKNGRIRSVDQLLELDGFGVKNLDKFCASVLREANAEGVQSDGITTGTATNTDQADGVVANAEQPKPTLTTRAQQFTTPNLTDAVRQTIRSCVAIHVGISSITWAHVGLSNDGADDYTDDYIDDVRNSDQPPQLIGWRFHGISDKRLHVGELSASVLDIAAQLPSADAYVLESPRIAQQGAPGSPAAININVQQAQIIGMISMAMAARGRTLDDGANRQRGSAGEEGGVGDGGLGGIDDANNRRVLYLRYLLASRLFQTVVGLERISTANVVAALLLDQKSVDGRQPAAAAASSRGSGETNPLAGAVGIAPEQRAAYESADGYCREFMGQALLMALAFVRLCVQQCPDSLAAVSRRTKNK